MLSRLRSEHESCRCALLQQKPCVRQPALIPRDGSQLLLLAAFERPLLNRQRPKGTYKS